MFFQKSFMTLGKALRQKFSEVLKHFSPIEGLSLVHFSGI